MDPTVAQAIIDLINKTPWQNHQGLVTGTMVFGILSAIAAALVTLTTSVNSLKTNTDNLAQIVTGFTGQIATVGTIANGAQSTASGAASSAAANAAAISTLQGYIGSINAALSTLGTTVAGHTTSIATNTAAIASNLIAIGALQAAVAALSSQTPPRPVTGTTDTLLPSDNGGWVEYWSASPVTVIVPKTAVPGFSVAFFQQGAGAISPVSGFGDQPPFEGPDGYVQTAGMLAVAGIYVYSNVDGQSAKFVAYGSMSPSS